MEELLFKLAELGINIGIRTWMKDKETYVVNNIFEITKFAKDFGCKFLEKTQLVNNIEQYKISFVSHLESSDMIKGIPEERQEVILNQLLKDVQSVNLSSSELAKKILEDEKLDSLILVKSENERKNWDEKEIGIYTNLVRYISDNITVFFRSLPDYSSESIKVLYQENSSAFEEITKRLDSIIAVLLSANDIKSDFRDYEINYKRDINNQINKIELFGASLSRSIKRYEISTSYIELSCLSDDSEGKKIEMSRLLDDNVITWISGEAGSGKTTFVQWLTRQQFEDAGGTLSDLVPIFVKLRMCDFPLNIGEYLYKEYNCKCPEGWIDYLIDNDKILLLLDGMDEVSRADRNDVYRFVENIIDKFGTKRIKSRIVITARPYIEDLFDLDHGKYSIMHMNTKNIEKFVFHWYRTIIEDADLAREKAEALFGVIRKSGELKNIAGTPLLCAMICALNYVSNETIPTNRNELYEKCCQMLIEDRDKERRIEADNLEIRKLDYTKKTRLLSIISLYMLTIEKTEIDKQVIFDELKKYLCNSTIISDASIIDDPTVLLDYLVRRTGILREPTKGKIDFIHKTFMEFLGAKEIVRSNRWDLFNGNVTRPFWKETIIMCFNDMSQEQATKMLRKIINEYSTTKNQELLFMASLCAQNSSDIEISIKQKIDREIKKLIPPVWGMINSLSAAGTYILPFLENNKKYNDEQRGNCISVLSRLLYDETESEAIRVLSSYLTSDCSAEIIKNVSYLLIDYPNEKLEEYSIGELVFNGLEGIITSDGICNTSWDALYLCKVPEGRASHLKGVKKIEINNDYGSDIEETDIIDSNTLLAFSEVSSIEIIDIRSDKELSCIKKLPNIESVSLFINENATEILVSLPRYLNCKKIKDISLFSMDLDIVYLKDFKEFQNIEFLSLGLGNRMLEYNFDRWDIFPKLKQVYICIDEGVYPDILESVERWREEYKDIYFDISYFGK
ncbi:MAG: NACHT domain-containing protein [Butyrivibrio hungatei]|nr:NACHT domain-containing protein [Butyrivibrio hungatei]